MTTNVGILLRATLVLLLVVAPASAEESGAIPKSFVASIGGFLGISYRIELREGGVLDYNATERGGREVQHLRITPAAADWRAFRAALDALEVWQWQPDFSNPGVSDGTQWSLDIAYADRVLKSRGSNNYPDSAGRPNGEPAMTPAFLRYLAAVEKLAGGHSFK